MNTTQLKKFAQDARRQLKTQVAVRIEAALSMEGAQAAENRDAIVELKQAILNSDKATVTERVAYIWFNRLCALRFMDANNYTLIRTVSPADGETQPELLADAKRGIIPDDLKVDKQRVIDLLTGKLPSTNAEGEAYRLLLVAICNYYHSVMPFMFEKIDDYSELLLPIDLLSDDSVVSKTVAAMDAEACEEVEVIGWLYQFYISEKKDEVFASKKKVSAENIPAATQLFTPNWIVRYLVENSLGRLWILNNPDSRLKEKMDYYIEPEQQEEDFLKIKSPEELRICDPAVGSGHMLVYAFDLLYAIYEMEGYASSQIPSLILENNLYGIEIDERAGGLAAFALTMKARQKSRGFFRKPTQPNICVLEDISFTSDEIDNYMSHVGKDLFTQDFWVTVRQFENATHFGSLIRPQMADAQTMYDRLQETGAFDDIFLHSTNARMRKLLEMVNYLSGKYHVVVANPPYMSRRAMDDDLKELAKLEYKVSKFDLFTMFVERGADLARNKGYISMITMQSWMFLGSYEKFREKLLKQYSLLSMMHLGANAFDTISGEVVQTTAFVLLNSLNEDLGGTFLRLVDGGNEADKILNFHRSKAKPFIVSSHDFKKIPGLPIAYWVSSGIRQTFVKGKQLGKTADIKSGMSTGDNSRFLRYWHEIDCNNIELTATDLDSAARSDKKWFPYNKGGTFRKWYGNRDYVVNWQNDGHDIKQWVVNNPSDPNTTHWSRRIYNTEYFFRPSLTWSKVTAGPFSLRYFPTGFIFDVAGCSIFIDEYKTRLSVLGALNSPIMTETVSALAPTLNFEVGQISTFPLISELQELEEQVSSDLVKISQVDWDSYEISWDFADLPLLHSEYHGTTLAATYANLRQVWREMTLEMQSLEEENNRIFIEAYGLQDELTPDVPLSEITLTCNPHYRYGSKISDKKREKKLLEDTMKEFISYAVGCMFGRYALEKEGLILANHGETRADYDRKVPNSSFPADKDNVIPILTENWFEDDIVERFGRFLRVTFGDDHYDENLRFIESALGVDSIRDYFIRESRNRNISDFYENDHVKAYNKRPIYWMFASENNAFCALVYMHRYRPDTVSVILNDYLREYRSKLEKEVEFLQKQATSTSASQADKTKAQDQMDRYQAIIKELREYEDDVLYPMATQQIDIDLDDGVAVNYEKLGDALYAISGLNK